MLLSWVNHQQVSAMKVAVTPIAPQAQALHRDPERRSRRPAWAGAPTA